MAELKEYTDPDGRSPFGRWFSELDGVTAVRIQTGLLRLRNGNVSKVKSVGAGVAELKMDFGPGYRVYFGRDGDTFVILLGGGTKKRQASDIDKAHARWADYRNQKRT